MTEKYKIRRFIADWRKRITEAAIGPLRDIIHSRFLSLRKKSCHVTHAINTRCIVFSSRRRNLDNWTCTLANYFDITNISQYINHAYLARLLSQTRILVCLHSCPQFLYLFGVFHLFPLILFFFPYFSPFSSHSPTRSSRLTAATRSFNHVPYFLASCFYSALHFYVFVGNLKVQPIHIIYENM